MVMINGSEVLRLIWEHRELILGVLIGVIIGVAVHYVKKRYKIVKVRRKEQVLINHSSSIFLTKIKKFLFFKLKLHYRNSSNVFLRTLYIFLGKRDRIGLPSRRYMKF